MLSECNNDVLVALLPWFQQQKYGGEPGRSFHSRKGRFSRENESDLRLRLRIGEVKISQMQTQIAYQVYDLRLHLNKRGIEKSVDVDVDRFRFRGKIKKRTVYRGKREAVYIYKFFLVDENYFSSTKNQNTKNTRQEISQSENFFLPLKKV